MPVLPTNVFKLTLGFRMTSQGFTENLFIKPSNPTKSVIDIALDELVAARKALLCPDVTIQFARVSVPTVGRTRSAYKRIYNQPGTLVGTTGLFSEPPEVALLIRYQNFTSGPGQYVATSHYLGGIPDQIVTGDDKYDLTVDGWGPLFQTYATKIIADCVQVYSTGPVGAKVLASAPITNVDIVRLADRDRGRPLGQVRGIHGS